MVLLLFLYMLCFTRVYILFMRACSLFMRAYSLFMRVYSLFMRAFYVRVGKNFFSNAIHLLYLFELVTKNY